MTLTRVLLMSGTLLACSVGMPSSAVAILCYVDADGDGYGDANDTGIEGGGSCGFGLVDNNLDCDDTDPSIYPNAPEVCDGVDNDCDGLVDESPTDGSVFYEDADGDGFGNGSSTVLACSPPPGYVTNDFDCDDTDASINPNAPEVCNGVDDDCNSIIDDDPVDGTSYYPDADGDGFGRNASPVVACSPPVGYVDNNLDCDDTNPSVNPDASEVCNSIDDDCDGTADNNPIDGATYYEDADGDGFGNATSFVTACSPVAGYVTDDSDCDDTDAGINPNAAEVCNGLDDDCDGLVDNNPTDGTQYYEDADGDGFGNSGSTVLACALPEGYVTNDADCDDNDASINPNAPEVCNGLDDDCDGTVDNNPTDGITYWEDADADGYGAGDATVLACSPPPGYADNNLDCDDTDASINPGASEFCNGLDDDCDGTADNNPVDGGQYYEDADADGYGSSSSPLLACSPPSGYVTNDFDCDDTDSDINPGATEICDSVDNDCDALVDEEGVCEVCPIGATGDANEDATITSADIIYLVNYVFKGGATPIPCEAVGDVNCDGSVTSADIIYLVNYVFKGGAPPCDVCTLIPGTWSCP